MKFNTQTAADYPMTIDYRPWEPFFDEETRLTWRNYQPAIEVKCRIAVSPIGAVSLFAKEQLQLFAIIQEMRDAAGTPVMNDVWYSVQKVVPVIDAQGYIASYKHSIAVLAPELVDQPIEPIVIYPDIDQQRY